MNTNAKFIVPGPHGHEVTLPTADLQALLFRDGPEMYTLTRSNNLQGYVFVDLKRDRTGVHSHCALIRLWSRDEILDHDNRSYGHPKYLARQGLSIACDLSLWKTAFVGYDDPAQLDGIAIGEVVWTSENNDTEQAR